MSVSNNRHGHSHDEFNTGFRLQWQERSIADTGVNVLGADAAPVQLVTTTGTGPAVVRLPLGAKDGKIFIIRALGAAAGITMTDDAGTPNAIVGSAPLALNTSGVYLKKGAAGSGSYVQIIESGVIA